MVDIGVWWIRLGLIGDCLLVFDGKSCCLMGGFWYLMVSMGIVWYHWCLIVCIGV